MNSLKKIYCRIGPKDGETLKDFLKSKFSASRGFFQNTFYDKECIRQQCHSGRRSFGDLLIISQTYYEDTTEEDLAEIIFDLICEGFLYITYCTGINKNVCYHSQQSVVDINGAFQKLKNMGDYYSKKGYDTHSWKNVAELRGLC